jgi:hypothetical protein
MGPEKMQRGFNCIESMQGERTSDQSIMRAWERWRERERTNGVETEEGPQ